VRARRRGEETSALQEGTREGAGWEGEAHRAPER
jgi:hypothetical protein